MPFFNLPQALALARQHQQAGRLAEAQQLCQEILQDRPNEPAALNRLGLIAHQSGRLDVALPLLARAAAAAPADPFFHHTLGRVHEAQGNLDAAIASYQAALRLKPDFPEALFDFAIALQRNGQLAGAASAYREVLRYAPGAGEVHNNLGAVLRKLRRTDEAVATLREALRLLPTLAEAHNNLGLALLDAAKPTEAIAAFLAAVRLKPALVEASYNLGNALQLEGRFDEAIAAYRDALQLRPDYAEVHSNLASVFREQGRLDDAVAGFHAALRLKPDQAESHNNLGNTFKDQGRLDDAIACFRAAIALRPEAPAYLSNVILTLQYRPEPDTAAIGRELAAWERLHAAPLRPHFHAYANDRSPQRRLRIGYVSPDFREHSVGRFILPLFENHNASAVEVFAYSDGMREDKITARLRARAHAWRKVPGVSDTDLAGVIAQDQIDILVDLTLHTANNRLTLFARKPAPVQVTYLAYPGTSGLSAIDYRLSDPWLDPVDAPPSDYSERTFHLAETYWCFSAPDAAPEISALPALGAGHVTFGSLGNFSKVTAPALTAWCRILRDSPGSRFLLHAPEGSHRQRVYDVFAAEGIDRARLEIVGQVPLADYHALCGRLDVALDPFPFAGATTTCDALWMGVPVVTLAGARAVSRGGLSILSNVGLPELVATSTEDYVRIAVELAHDLPRLADLRANLRTRLQHSPVMNAPLFAQNVEAAYRTMWLEFVGPR